MRLFNFGVNNRLSVVRLCDEYCRDIGWTLSGRVFGWYITGTWFTPRYAPRVVRPKQVQEGHKEEGNG